MNNKKNIVYLPNDQHISDFINTVVIYMYNNQNRNYIIIGSDYLYLEDELLEIINNLENRVELFIEKSSSLAKLLIDIDLKWTIINGYKIIFKKEYNKYYHISIYRPKITILYLTDKIDDVLENCKKSIYKYSKKYNYNFINQKKLIVVNNFIIKENIDNIISENIKSKEVETNLEDVVNKTLYDAPDFVQYDEILIKRLNKQAMESPRAVSYFEGRKITKESIVRFDLGYSEKQDSVVVPMHSPDSMCIGFVARTVEAKEFKNTPGLPKSKILFNLHRVKSSKFVYVVESSFDAIRLDQVGFPAVATLGANVSSSQMKLLEKYFNNVVLVADNDEAGSIMADRLTEKLGSLVTIIKLDKQYKDIGDMNDDAIRQLEYSFDNSIIAMLK